MEEEMNKESSI